MPYKITLAVKSQKGICHANHKVGDTFEIVGPSLLQGGICLAALTAISPYICAMKYGADFPWLKANKDDHEACCPDPHNPVVFEIKRIKLDEKDAKKIYRRR